MKLSSFLLNPRDKPSLHTETKAALFRGLSRKEIEAIIANNPSLSRSAELMKKFGYTYRSTIESWEDRVIVFHKPSKWYVFYNIDTGFLSINNSFYTAEVYYWIDEEVLEHLDAETSMPMIAIFSHEIPWGNDGKTAYSFRLYDTSLQPTKLTIGNESISHLIFSAKDSWEIIGRSLIESS